jgi:FkbM family methyltransferase
MDIKNFDFWKSFLKNRNSKLLSIMGNNEFFIKGTNCYKLNVTDNHPLYEYMKTYKLYDRFLPSLVKNTGSGLIDIGANIGDTTIIVKSLSDCEVICVEPDNIFASLLRQNISENNLSQVRIFPHAISSIGRNVEVEKNDLCSTGNLIDSETGSKTFTIREMVSDLKIELGSFHTIKIDTDGFDWDVLDSIVNYYTDTPDVRRFKFIYFEFQFYLNSLGFNDHKMDWRIAKFVKVIQRLKVFGYDRFYLFDNFGTFMFVSENESDIINVINYIKRTQTDNNAPTLWFCDVLMCNASDVLIVEESLQNYVNVEFDIYK